MNPFIVAGAHAKAAMSPLQEELASKWKNDLVQAALLSAGAGAAARGGVGLINLVRRNLAPPEPKYPMPISFDAPYPVYQPHKKQEHQAGNVSYATPAMLGLPEGEKTAQDGGGTPAIMFPEGATAKTNLAFYLPSIIGTGMVGGFTGWKAMDSILDSRRKREQQEQLEGAKQDFEKALVGSYPQPKTAGEELGNALDALYDNFTKEAFMGANPLGFGLGAYGAYAAMTGLPVAAIAYDAARKAHGRAAIEKAMQKRIQMEYEERPSATLAVPDPVPVDQPPLQTAPRRPTLM